MPVVPDEIPVIHFSEALALVGAPADEPDLAPEHERALGAWALAEHGSDFLAVEGYPMAQAAVLHAPAARRTRSWSNSFDLLFRGLELVTGGQRLHRPSDYDAAIRARGEDPATTRRTSRRSGTGCRRTAGSRSGWSAGSARLVEAANIREVTLFPRDLTG